jgi:phage terminase large subunit-like protein
MFHSYIRAVIERGKLIFPEDFCVTKKAPEDENKKALDEIQASLGPYLWAGNYYNNPVSDELVEFREDWFLRFRYDDENAQNELKESFTVMSIDPATKDKETNDPTGWVVSKVAPSGYVRVVLAQPKKVRPNEMIEETFRLVSIYQPDVVMIETVSANILWIDLFTQKMKKDKTFFRLEEYDPGTKETKPAKIRKLIPYYARGQVLHAPGLTELERQLREFPRNANDDLIDALQAQIPYWTGKTVKVERPIEKYTSEWWDKLRSLNKPNGGTAEQKLFEEYRKLPNSQRIAIRKPNW